MAKVKKSRRNIKKKSTVAVSLEVLEIQGQEYLQTKKFGKAIDIFKQLVKRDSALAYQESLAQAYLCRARGLANKGMVKEALTLLENRERFCPAAVAQTPCANFKINLLIATGHPRKAAALYSLESSHGNPNLGAVSDLLAALILSGETILLGELREDDSLVGHLPFACAALQAYCAHSDDEVRQQLKQISFRSPYRNFALALKGLLLLASDKTAAVGLFSKIPFISPFYALVRPIQLCAAADESLVAALAQMKRSDLQLLAGISGVTEQQLGLLVDLQKAQAQPQKQIELLCFRMEKFDAESAKRACLNLLPLHPGGEYTYKKAFSHISLPEAFRVQALAFEHYQDSDQALVFWRKYVEHLKQESDSEENELTIALVFRHMAELCEYLGSSYFDPDSQAAYVENLAQSVIHDPADKATYLKLFERCRKDKSAMRRWLDSALKYFPADIDILLVAATFAQGNNAYKKTARFAKLILDVDPINTRARALMLQAQLAHGRKLTESGNLGLAAREFVLAEEQQRSPLAKGTARICQGLLSLMTKADVAGQSLIAEGQKMVGLPCKAWLITAIEAQLMGLPQREQKILNQQLKATNSSILGKSELFDLLEQVEIYHLQAPQIMKNMAILLRPLFKNAAKLEFLHAESLNLCEAFYRKMNFFLLKTFAPVAEKRWTESPIFVFFRLYAKSKGNSSLLNAHEQEQLDCMYDMALDRNDLPLTQLIDEFINSSPFSEIGKNDFEKFIKQCLVDYGDSDLDEPVPAKKRLPKPTKPKTTDKKNDNSDQLKLF